MLFTLKYLHFEQIPGIRSWICFISSSKYTLGFKRALKIRSYAYMKQLLQLG